MKPILVAHSKTDEALAIERALIERGWSATLITRGAEVMDLIDRLGISVLVVERDLPDMSGWDLLERLSTRPANIRVIVTSPENTARSATRALGRGAFDYLAEPIDEEDLARCLDRIQPPAGRPTGPSPPDPDRFINIVGQSKAIKSVFRLVDKVAATDSTVMIYGESGTGKELIAQAIHQNSPRRDKPLIPVNCGAIPEELLESELFGHEKGAFTSAIRTRVGRFELADGGTIFLDEIADMSPKLQVKILRVLQEHQFERIGGGKTIHVDIRVITATNKNLRQAVEEGRFREDLFYRLNVIPITVPPLRDRREDVPLLVDHFLQRFMNAGAQDIRGIDPPALKCIQDYNWPGNIRELENIIERMAILAEGDILSLEDLPPRISEAAPFSGSPATIQLTEAGIDFNQVVSEFENELIRQALDLSGGVKNQAAQLLKLNRTTLVEKMKKKGIKP